MCPSVCARRHSRKAAVKNVSAVQRRRKAVRLSMNLNGLDAAWMQGWSGRRPIQVIGLSDREDGFCSW